MVDHGCTHAVIEVSRHALTNRWLGGVAVDAACLTDTRHHERGGPRSIRADRRAKSRLLEHLTVEGLAAVSADDPVALDELRLHDGPVLTVGMQCEAEITATLVERCASEQTILLCAGSDLMPLRTRMIGIQHAYNCLTAAAVGLAYGIDLPTVVRGLEAIDYVPGRMERIECGQPFGVFVDGARTPEALSACLQTLREVVPGRLMCVFGAQGQRHRRRRPLVGRAVEAGADLAVVTDDNPRREDPQAILEDILGGLERPAEAEVIPDRTEAIAWALSQARTGDCVLIAGKGHRTQQIVGGHRRYFDDRQVARRWLYAKQQL
jgi:UDP-N-acetylmuramoyl-L-alanyl-D-glutamate--2,6-diaminopimelate ligase